MMDDDGITNNLFTFKRPEKKLGLPLPTLIDGEPRIRDLDLATALGFENERQIRELIGRRIQALEHLGSLSYRTTKPGPQGGRPGKEFWLNRKQAIFITAKSETLRATEITIEVVERFDAYERGPVRTEVDMRNPATLAAAALQLIQINDELRREVEIAGPKAAVYDRVMEADGLYSLTEAAKVMGMQPRKLMQRLAVEGFIYRNAGSGNWLAYQHQMQRGLFEHRVHMVHDPLQGDKARHQCMITPKGIMELTRRFGCMLAPA